jgi:acyl carrier protein
MCLTFEKLKFLLYEKFSFHYEQIQLETKLELELGIDSREMLELFNELEQVFEIDVDFNEIDHILETIRVLTISDLVGYIERKRIKNQVF